MSDIEQQIQARVQGFVSELSVLVRQAALAAVESALTGEAPVTRAPRPAAAAPAKRGPGRPAGRPVAAPVAPKAATPKAKSAARKPGEKRSPEELVSLTERLADHIKSNKGQGVEAIAKALGRKTRELSLPIKKLLSSKRISSQGHKRATRYFPSK